MNKKRIAEIATVLAFATPLAYADNSLATTQHAADPPPVITEYQPPMAMSNTAEYALLTGVLVVAAAFAASGKYFRPDEPDDENQRIDSEL